MQTVTASAPLVFEAPVVLLERIRRSGPLILTVLAHLGLIYALQNGLIRNVTQALPKEIFVSLMPSPATPAASKPAPKTIPVARPALTAPTPLVPVVNTAPAENAMAIAPSEPKTVHSQDAAAPVPATPPAAPAQPKTISGIEYIQAPRLEYPGISRRMGEAGKVTLRVLVNDKGRAEKVEIEKSSGFQRLDEAARQALLRAQFKPYVEDGKELSFWTSGTFTFDLNS